MFSAISNADLRLEVLRQAKESLDDDQNLKQGLNRALRMAAHANKNPSSANIANANVLAELISFELDRRLAMNDAALDHSELVQMIRQLLGGLDRLRFRVEFTEVASRDRERTLFRMRPNRRVPSGRPPCDRP